MNYLNPKCRGNSFELPAFDMFLKYQFLEVLTKILNSNTIFKICEARIAVLFAKLIQPLFKNLKYLAVVII